MSENRSPRDDEYREWVARMEREFQPRGDTSDDRPERGAEPIVERAPVDTAPQYVSFSLARARPRAVYVLLAANVIMYVLTNVLTNRISLPYVDAARGFVTNDAFTAALYVLGAKLNTAIDAGQWWRLLTPMVLHGSLAHLAFNSLALYSLGPQVESTYGTDRFLTIYALAGLAGSVASYWFNPNALSVGASGAIFGLFSALAAFAYTSRSLLGAATTKTQLGQMATLVAINLAFGFVPGSNIDNSAHIGGLLVGGLAGYALAPRYSIERQGHQPALVRRDRPALGWIVSVITLGALVAVMILARFSGS